MSVNDMEATAVVTDSIVRAVPRRVSEGKQNDVVQKKAATVRPATVAAGRIPTADTLSRTVVDSVRPVVSDTLGGGVRDTLIYRGADTLALWPVADSVAQAAVPADTLFRDVEAAEIFGARSVTATVAMPYTLHRPSPVRQPLFQSFVLVLAFAFALVLNKYLPDVKALLGNVFTYHNTGDRLSPGSNNNNLLRLLDSSSWVGVFMLGAVVVRFFGGGIPDGVTAWLNGASSLVAALAAVAALLVVHLYQFVVLRGAGEVLLCRMFISQLWQVKRICFSLLVLFAMPPMLLYMFIPAGSGGWLLITVVITCFVTLFLYLKETVELFISKKISILHWFLYLCTVELFPISLLGLLVVKRL